MNLSLLLLPLSLAGTWTLTCLCVLLWLPAAGSDLSSAAAVGSDLTGTEQRCILGGPPGSLHSHFTLGVILHSLCASWSLYYLMWPSEAAALSGAQTDCGTDLTEGGELFILSADSFINSFINSFISSFIIRKFTAVSQSGPLSEKGRSSSCTRQQEHLNIKYSSFSSGWSLKPIRSSKVDSFCARRRVFHPHGSNIF